MNSFEKLPIEKQARIVNASISEFAERDYGNASMNKVVEQAGISKGSLFNYFKTKSSLFFHIYHLAIGEVKSYLREVRDETAGLSFDVRLSKIVSAGIQFITDHPRLARIYFRLVYSSESPHRKKILNELQLMSGEYLGRIINDAIDRNELNQNLNTTQAVFFLDAVLTRFLKEYHEALDSGEEERIEQGQWVQGITDLFTKGLK